MDKRSNAVSRALAGLFPSASSAGRLADAAGVRTELVDLSGAPIDFWYGIVREADKTDSVRALVEAALEDYPENAALRAYIEEDAQAVEGPKPGGEVPWRTDVDAPELERVMEDQSTFLPIHFLEAGTTISRSVARVLLPDGSGSGFVTADDLFVTNHHVLPDAAAARTATLQFNYQKTVDGLDAVVTDVPLRPDDGFVSSTEFDVTVVRAEPGVAQQWGAVPVIPRSLEDLRWVNIVQHPGGGPKQIALYHNLVSYVDDTFVQYYTDTMPGSSGSPVFDSDWNLVAIHHSGGWIRQPNTKKQVFRNEGINVARIAEVVASVESTRLPSGGPGGGSRP